MCPVAEAGSGPVIVRAIGDSADLSLPERGVEAGFLGTRYLRLARQDAPGEQGIFVVNPLPREGGDGEIHVQPGQLGLAHDQCAPVSATAASAWDFRFAQLRTRNGMLVLGVLAASLGAAWIDGSLALGKSPESVLMRFDAATLAAMAAVAVVCKLISPVLAFLLALWFKK